MASPRRNDNRVIIHIDYDCFYASVFEAENPALKSLPLAVQQKQIVVTCNYEARRRGLRKLQLIKEAKQICPDVIIVLGEDLTRFRDVSKSLYGFLKGLIWSQKAERLGFDEVFLDVTDMVDYNMSLLNHHDLHNSFFCLDDKNPTVGFEFDATLYCGLTFPRLDENNQPNGTAFGDQAELAHRLRLGSHLANHIRSCLDHDHGYTATVGISTSKLLAKLVGNVNKPNNQTTLIPPYSEDGNLTEIRNVIRFIDDHEVGAIPGIGFKSAQKIRSYILHHEATFVPYTERSQKDEVRVREIRLSPGMGPLKLTDLLGGPGASRDIGFRTWGLLNGVDNSEVLEARSVPTQISIEDSYLGIWQFEEVRKQLQLLATSLVKRMRIDLLDDRDLTDKPRWKAFPRTIRLSTRRKSPRKADGSRDNAYVQGRISRSAPAPKLLFSLTESAEAVAEKLVNDHLLSMFRKLHPEKSFGELNLINVAVTNMAEGAAGEDRLNRGRDIGKMFKEQKHATQETATAPDGYQEDMRQPTDMAMNESVWEESDEEDYSPSNQICNVCGCEIPSFAYSAHALYHAEPD